MEWCFEHPWMTIILLLILFGSVKIHITTNKWAKGARMGFRIHELEEILCPCQQHDWVEIQEEGKEMVRICRTCKKMEKREQGNDEP